MRIIIAGSRTITNYQDVVDAIKLAGFGITEIVSGTAQGADLFGERFADEYNISCVRFPADWKTHGKSAGPKRNIEMGNYADGAVVVWDGKSTGAKHMANYMKSLGKPVYLYLPHMKKGMVLWW